MSHSASTSVEACVGVWLCVTLPCLVPNFDSYRKSPTEACSQFFGVFMFVVAILNVFHLANEVLAYEGR
jgi:hypothetical protein